MEREREGKGEGEERGVLGIVLGSTGMRTTTTMGTNVRIATVSCERVRAARKGRRTRTSQADPRGDGRPRPKRDAAIAAGWSGLSTAPWTADQVAGMAVGVGLVALAAAAWKADRWVAQEQRKQLGLCPRCGGVGCEACRNETVVQETHQDVP